MSLPHGTRRPAAPAGPPVVSVIIPAYDCAAYIGETLASVFAQTLPDFEVVVVNDGSPDTVELERALEPFRSRIVYLARPNGGPGAARNEGIRVASAPLIAFLDADDLWEPTFLEEQVGFLAEHPEIDLVFADGVAFGRCAHQRSFMEEAPPRGTPTMERLLALECGIGTSTVVVRRAPVVEIGGFDEDRHGSEDFDLWVRLAKHGARMTYRRRVLLHYRVHAGSFGADAVRAAERVERTLAKTATRPDLTPAERAALERTRARNGAFLALEHGKLQLAAGDFDAALARLTHAYRYRPRWKLGVAIAGLRLLPALVRGAYGARRLLHRTRPLRSRPALIGTPAPR